MAAVEVSKALSMVSDLKALDSSLRVECYGSTVLVDSKRLGSLDGLIVRGWLIPQTNQLSRADRKQLHETIRELELIVD